MLNNLFSVALGSALGGCLRYIFSLYLPYPILLVNILGSFAIGFIAYKLPLEQNHLLLFLTTGFLGGFTTFSAFSLEFLKLGLEEKFLPALIYLFNSVFFSIAASYLGYRLAK